MRGASRARGGGSLGKWYFLFESDFPSTQEGLKPLVAAPPPPVPEARGRKNVSVIWEINIVKPLFVKQYISRTTSHDSPFIGGDFAQLHASKADLIALELAYLHCLPCRNSIQAYFTWRFFRHDAHSKKFQDEGDIASEWGGGSLGKWDFLFESDFPSTQEGLKPLVAAPLSPFNPPSPRQEDGRMSL
ncbi:hypothetical protein CDAR_445881 [Caerostris darwini]|uniref:Uncharacterized protein n=1 Tax=Caerostris darwini TaxID=1538125 RepID=A0AAV4U0F6_9ARAC|nr:hypothetical protein CDAR_445881 [Caerostris darwini]